VSRHDASLEPRSATLYLRPWRVDVDVRPGVPLLVPMAVLARTIRDALVAAGAPSPASIGLILSNDAELTELNESQMGHEGPTDVLSFPLLPPDAFPPHEGGPADEGVEGVEGDDDDADEASMAPEGFILPPGVRTHLGEIIVSVERAIEQASEGRGGQTSNIRWSSADELRLLVTHGTLHVCGWDHAEPAEEAAMRRLEQELLAASSGGSR
jgi:probable rRNA maturation factor